MIPGASCLFMIGINLKEISEESNRLSITLQLQKAAAGSEKKLRIIRIKTECRLK